MAEKRKGINLFWMRMNGINTVYSDTKERIGIYASKSDAIESAKQYAKQKKYADREGGFFYNEVESKHYIHILTGHPKTG